LLLHQQCRGIATLEDSADHALLEVAAGENWHRFVASSLQSGLFGLENLALIPGTVGAAPIQNIGAYGVEVGRYIERVNCRTLPDGEALQLAGADCEFGYRDSVFKGHLRDAAVVESVVFRLPRTPRVEISYPALAAWLEGRGIDAPTPQQVFDAVVAIRRSRLPDPAETPNAGSFFKNPVVTDAALASLLRQFPALPHFPDTDRPGCHKLAAAWLIEQCGFKQFGDAAVHVHLEHALVIVNPQHRPGAEILALAERIVAVVEGRFGLRLEREPRCYG
jgi:UDP-N-acetylmuramate dehydrogenase